MLAKELAPAVLQRAGVNEFKRLGEVAGAALEGLQLAHPFYERTVPVVLGDHVTLDAGTGLVHTAPGHGHEDYDSRPEVQAADRQSGRQRRPLRRRARRCSKASTCSKRTST